MTHEHHHPRGAVSGHLGHRRRAVWFLVAFLGLTGLGAVSAALGAAPEPHAPCPRSQPACVAPPPSPRSLAPRLVTETEYRDPRGRFRFEYPPDVLAVKPTSDGVSVQVRPDYDQGDFALIFHDAPATTSPAALVRAETQALSGQILGLAPSSDPRETVLDPVLGFRNGVGGQWSGTIRAGARVSTPVQVTQMAATDGRTSVLMTLLVSSTSEKRIGDLRQQTDHLLNSFRFGADVRVRRGGDPAWRVG